MQIRGIPRCLNTVCKYPMEAKTQQKSHRIIRLVVSVSGGMEGDVRNSKKDLILLKSWKQTENTL